jgi:hypothetical protein
MWKLLSQPIITIQLPMWAILPRLDAEHRGLVIRGYALSARCRLICLGIAACHIFATPGFVTFLEGQSDALKADLAALRRDIGAWRRAIESRAHPAPPAPFVNPWA